MIGHNAQNVADIRPGIATRKIEKTMLLGKARDPGFGVLQDQPKAVEPAAGIAL